MLSPVKRIQLPPTHNGYYRFGDLPGLIAEARHPETDSAADYTTKVVIWRDDGTEAGKYFECVPPEGVLVEGYEDADEWVETLVPLPEAERGYLNARWHEQRKPIDERARPWPDGSLVLSRSSTQGDVMWVLNVEQERESYAKRLTHAAQLPIDAPGYLPVVDSNENELTFRHGAALDSGWVHIDWLNNWGKVQRPENAFGMAGASGLGVESPAKTDDYEKQLKARIATIATGYAQEQIEAGRHPSKLIIAEHVAKRLKEINVMGKGGGPLSAEYIKRHYLEGISTAESRRLSTSIRRGK